MNSAFATRLKEALAMRGMTPAELSDISGVYKSSISMYLSGGNDPKQKAVYLMAKALSVDPSWLMGFDLVAPIVTPSRRDIPLLSQYTPGEPLLTYVEAYVDAQDDREDFAIRVLTDHMAGSRIQPGDIIYVERNPMDLKNGDIIFGEIAGKGQGLARYYRYDKKLILRFDNPQLDEIECNPKDLAIYGKVVRVSFKLT